jgi:hypothetical protein
MCSTLTYGESPLWKYAHNTSRARGRNCYFFVGCAHAKEVFPPATVVDEARDFATIENAWALRCEELFKAKTDAKPWDEARKAEWLKNNPGQRLPIIAEGWTDVQRANFKRALDGRYSLPGATEPLDFGEKEPAKLGPMAEAVRRELDSPF